MAQIKRLTARQVETLGPGFHADGANLFLQVREPSAAQRLAGGAAGSRAWVFRYKRAKKVVQIGLGSTADRTLAQARDVAGKMRTALADGTDPAAVLKARRGDEAKAFKAYAAEVVAAKEIGWKSEKHTAQWTATLEAYAYPIVGNKRPRDITVADVKAILNPLWATKTETASRLRQRIEAVIDYAAVHEGDDRRNPARWKGNLDKLFQSPRKVTKPIHHPALQYDRVPALMDELRQKDSTSALNLRWTILTIARSGESRGAKWTELNSDETVWIVPPERMKAGKEHRVPLCKEAIEILAVMKKRKVKDCDYIFPGPRGGLLSDVAVNKTLHAIEPGVSVHGFRSSFRQWGAETTSYSSAVLELALAHTDPNKVQAAYQRSDLFKLRRDLMAIWGKYLTPRNNVVRLSKVG